MISSLEFSYLCQNLNCLSNKDLNRCSLESVGRNLILSNCLRLLSTASLINYFLSKISPNHPYPFKPLHPTVPPFVISSASQFLKNKTNRIFHQAKFWPRFHPFFLSRTERRWKEGWRSYLGRDVGRDVLAAGIKLWSAQGSGDTTMLAGNKHTHTPPSRN